MALVFPVQRETFEELLRNYKGSDAETPFQRMVNAKRSQIAKITAGNLDIYWPPNQWGSSSHWGVSAKA